MKADPERPEQIARAAIRKLDLGPIVKLLQRDVPMDAIPYFRALRDCVREVELLREAIAKEASTAQALAEFGKKTGASPWT